MCKRDVASRVLRGRRLAVGRVLRGRRGPVVEKETTKGCLPNLVLLRPQAWHPLRGGVAEAAWPLVRSGKP